MRHLETIKDIKKAVSLHYGPRLVKMIVYGSVARGDDRPDSDIDIMVVLDDMGNVYDEIDELVECSYGIQLDHPDNPISLYPVSRVDFDSLANPPIRSASKDGIGI